MKVSTVSSLLPLSLEDQRVLSHEPASRAAFEFGWKLTSEQQKWCSEHREQKTSEQPK